MAGAQRYLSGGMRQTQLGRSVLDWTRCAPAPSAETLLTAALKRMLPSGSCAASASRISDRRMPLACKLATRPST